MLSPETTLIAKEHIPSLRFPRQPVSITDEQRHELQDRMLRATRLGNGEHGKCRIIFADAEGIKAVETTIWTFDQDNIVLKYGMTIPVFRVLRIEFP
ncbi:MAG: hypothetical protein KIT10_08040 [Flavobacteriales bacterium]|nr:hypothetical protein [Flavobacteriales bacterium]